MDAGVPTPQALLALTAGETATCAILADKTARCWGLNNAGQLGDGSNSRRERPTAVSGLTNVTSLSIGYEHACALKEDGTAWCWGANPHGQLGNGDPNIGTASNVPVQVIGLSNAASIHAGVWQTCARHTDGTVSCWGRGGYLGSNSVVNTSVPTAVPGLTGVAQLSVASNSGTSVANHVCGRRTNGTVFCWGLNSDGQLGTGNQNDSRTPVDVPGINDAEEVTAGGSHACARRPGGVYCWGFFSGDGTLDRRTSPTLVQNSAGVTAIEAGNNFNIALRGTSFICWGSNSRGQCGDGITFPASGPVYSSPQAGLQMNATLIAAGDAHSCAYVGSTMVTWCWGSNDWGELGYGVAGTPSRISTPDFVRW